MGRRDLAIDLGTASTLVFQQGVGIVYDEPSVVAVNPRNGEVVAIGREVAEMAGTSPGVVGPSRPLQRGVISDFEQTEQMLRVIFKRLGIGRFPRPRMLVCVPSILTPVERKAVEQAVT